MRKRERIGIGSWSGVSVASTLGIVSCHICAASLLHTTEFAAFAASDRENTRARAGIMAVDAGSVLLYQVMPSVFVIGLLCLLLQKKSSNNSDLRAPLLSGDTVEHRVDAAAREAEAGFRVCSGCEFENFKRSAYCCLCGEKLPKEPASATTSGSARRNESQLETPTHARQLRTQQIRVRKRKEWTRKLDVNGNMFWYRSCLKADETAPSSSQSPGFCVAFKSPSKEDMPPKEDGVETVAPGIVKMDESLQMVLLSSSDANPAVSPTGSATLQSKERMKEVVEFAAKDFPTKYAHFVVSTAALIVPAEVAFLKLSVHREYMLEESIDHIGCIKEKNIHSYMRITFLDESGVDAGGVHREWFMLLAEQLLNPTMGLFQCTNKTEQSYYLNPNSAHTIGEEHLTYNYAAGRLIGRALLEGTVWGFHLAMPLIKIILGIPITFSDLEYLDPEAYRSMQWLLANDGVEDIGLDFSVTEKQGDELVTVDLIPNGRNIAVTDANKHEYLERKFHYMVFESVSSQLYMFLKGLYEVIPQELLMLYDAEEFDYLLCGTQEIDVEDWKAHTVASTDMKWNRTLGWFWDVVADMPNEYRRRLLQFTTGSSRVPLAGFAGLTSYDGRLCPFTLKGIPCSASRYISSHACFNRLDVPAYSSKKKLKKILYATLDTELYGFTTA